MKSNEEIIQEYHDIKELMRQPGFPTLMKHLQEKYEGIIKEVEKAEGNKDYISGKMFGIKFCLEEPMRIIRAGEEAKQILQDEENKKE